MRDGIRILGLVVLVTIGFAATVYALPSVGHDTFYYEGAVFNGDPVGEDYRGCSNSHFSWGYTTDYIENYEWDCEEYYECYRFGISIGGGYCAWSANTCEEGSPIPCPTYF